MAKLLVSSVIYSFQISVRKITIIGLAWPGPRPGHRSDGLSQAKSTKIHPGRGPGLAGHQAPARQQARPTALIRNTIGKRHNPVKGAEVGKMGEKVGKKRLI